MKKIIVLTIVLSLLVALCACGNVETTASTTSAMTTQGDLRPTQPPSYTTYRFDTYDELQDSFFGEKGESYQKELVAEHPDMTEMVSCLTQNGDIPVPRLGGSAIPLRQEMGFNDITIFSSEMHRKPWIWFHCLYKGNYFRVQYTYTTLFDIEEGETDVAKLIEAAEPGFPNAENIEEYEDLYNQIVNGKITIGNETLPCVFYEIKEYSLNRVSFLYNGLYVMIYADFTQLDEDFFKNFSIG